MQELSRLPSVFGNHSRHEKPREGLRTGVLLAVSAITILLVLANFGLLGPVSPLIIGPFRKIALLLGRIIFWAF